jgi:hypothetical protein
MANTKTSLYPYLESLERLWDALPLECPMRVAGREQFDALWSDPDPYAMATVDPTVVMHYSPIFSRILLKDAQPYQTETLEKHFTWLVQNGTDHDIQLFVKNLTECRKNMASPDQILIDLIGCVGYTEAVELVEDDECWTAKQRQIREKCCNDFPDSYPKFNEADRWRDLFTRVNRHCFLHKDPRGRPSKNAR